jgi:hypothetical protein
MKHIYLMPLPRGPGMVTDRWEVKAKKGDHHLGRICWKAQWRCYVFMPCYPTVFEQDCLRDIANFIEQATIDHKSGNVPVKGKE